MLIQWLHSIDELESMISTDMIRRLRTTRHMCHKTSDRMGYLLSFQYVGKGGPKEGCHVIIYAETQKVYLVCKNQELRTLIASMVPDIPSGGAWLAGFFTALTETDVDFFEQLEEDITGIEDELLTNVRTGNEITRRIITVRRDLLKRKRYYEQLDMIVGELNSNTDDFFTQESLKGLNLADKRIDRLMAAVLHLQEYVTQIREAYQAQIDIEQNNIMRIFTVITAICLPLSLIAGWYGMNLMMPEYTWPYGYPLVVAVSVAIVIVCCIIFKRKKWF